MPTSKRTKHGSGKAHKPKPLRYNPEYTVGLSKELQDTIKAKLTLPELIDLENQLRKCVKRATHDATMKTHKTTWAVTLRVLHDRFGFEAYQKKALYDGALDYLRDVAEKRITVQEMLDTLEIEDGIRLTWSDEDEL